MLDSELEEEPDDPVEGEVVAALEVLDDVPDAALWLLPWVVALWLVAGPCAADDPSGRLTVCPA